MEELPKVEILLKVTAELLFIGWSWSPLSIVKHICWHHVQPPKNTTPDRKYEEVCNFTERIQYRKVQSLEPWVM